MQKYARAAAAGGGWKKLTYTHTHIQMHVCICMPNCMPDTRQFGYAHENTVLLTHTCTRACIVVHTHTHTAAVEQFHFICKLSFFEYHIRFFLFSRPSAFKISSEIFFAALVFHIRVCVRMYVCLFVLTCVRTYVQHKNILISAASRAKLYIKS